MAQVTLYLDEATEALLNEAADANGVSKSRWVADLIRQYAHHTWPAECVALAGRFPDFPLRDDSASAPQDLPRLGF